MMAFSHKMNALPLYLIISCHLLSLGLRKQMYYYIFWVFLSAENCVHACVHLLYAETITVSLPQVLFKPDIPPDSVWQSWNNPHVILGHYIISTSIFTVITVIRIDQTSCNLTLIKSVCVLSSQINQNTNNRSYQSLGWLCVIHLCAQWQAWQNSQKTSHFSELFSWTWQCC